jgi:kynureninase
MMVGCCYKYLNGGPGAPAFLYIRRELQSQLRNPIQGWFGAANPFAFSATYEPTLGIEQFAVGTPNVLSLAAIEPGVDLVLEAGIERIRQRSLELTDRLIEALDRLPTEWGITISTPRRASNRGSHVSIQHENAWQITQALIRDFNVIPDYREPSIIRFGITPLYTNEQEIDRAVAALRAILQERMFLRYSPEKRGVT